MNAIKEQLEKWGITNYTVVNPDDQDYHDGHSFLFQLTRVGFVYVVYETNCLQAAIDELIDFLVTDSPGLISEEEELEFPEEFLCGGNCGYYINTQNYRIRELS